MTTCPACGQDVPGPDRSLMTNFYCQDCPDHEACAQGAPCELVRSL